MMFMSVFFQFQQMQHATSISAEEQRIAALRSGQLGGEGGG